uniref:Uncharacterized protein n=1 Tax=Chromera velia CCMP2878 TaxID=1169474 RepID=A0A0G4GY77_9ALVE|eukprot:Cvel_23883.t1-p1 / transcript=Cvel_23883.t1 / gene=Cvel_23883 / organism=Chromera_velia_CCMP2878 / gene_product=hypothetical protein / transcript_product=hypothetical protein / location=Cvel_scaffold2515:11168-25833(+) / protein_length=205 / sequence_SO=supercontig / SO=protein_coding / is_pseudo=false
MGEDELRAPPTIRNREIQEGAGVKQGNPLSPLLFLLFINNLHRHIRLSAHREDELGGEELEKDGTVSDERSIESRTRDYSWVGRLRGVGIGKGNKKTEVAVKRKKGKVRAFQGVMSMNHQSWGSMTKMVFSAETVARDFDSLFDEQNNIQHPETGDQLRCVIPRTKEQTDAATKKWAVGVMGDAASSDQKKEEARKALQRLGVPL